MKNLKLFFPIFFVFSFFMNVDAQNTGFLEEVPEANYSRTGGTISKYVRDNVSQGGPYTVEGKQIWVMIMEDDGTQMKFVDGQFAAQNANWGYLHAGRKVWGYGTKPDWVRVGNFYRVNNVYNAKCNNLGDIQVPYVDTKIVEVPGETKIVEVAGETKVVVIDNDEPDVIVVQGQNGHVCNQFCGASAFNSCPLNQFGGGFGPQLGLNFGFDFFTGAASFGLAYQNGWFNQFSGGYGPCGWQPCFPQQPIGWGQQWGQPWGNVYIDNSITNIDNSINNSNNTTRPWTRPPYTDPGGDPVINGGHDGAGGRATGGRSNQGMSLGQMEKRIAQSNSRVGNTNYSRTNRDNTVASRTNTNARNNLGSNRSNLNPSGFNPDTSNAVTTRGNNRSTNVNRGATNNLQQNGVVRGGPRDGSSLNPGDFKPNTRSSVANRGNNRRTDGGSNFRDKRGQYQVDGYASSTRRDKKSSIDNNRSRSSVNNRSRSQLNNRSRSSVNNRSRSQLNNRSRSSVNNRSRSTVNNRSRGNYNRSIRPVMNNRSGSSFSRGGGSSRSMSMRRGRG